MTNPYEAPLSDPVAARPTRVRYLVAAIAVLLAVVTYLDRACISVLKSDIAGDLSLSDKQMGWVFSALPWRMRSSRSRRPGGPTGWARGGC